MRGAFMFEGRRYYVSGKDKTEVEVNKAMRLKELQEGVIIESNMLTKDWAIVWMETYKAGACNDKTYRDYEHRLDKFILPEIGYIRLKDVKQVHLQEGACGNRLRKQCTWKWAESFTWDRLWSHVG